MRYNRLFDIGITKRRARIANAAHRKIWKHYENSGLLEIDRDALADLCLKTALKDTDIQSDPPDFLKILAVDLISESGLFFDAPLETGVSTYQRVRHQGFWDQIEYLANNPKSALTSTSKDIAEILELITRTIGPALGTSSDEIGFDVPIKDVIGDPLSFLKALDQQICTAKRPNSHNIQYGIANASYHFGKERILREAVGLEPREDWGSKRKPKIGDSVLGSPDEQFEKFLKDTAFESLLTANVRVSIKPNLRLEHMMFIAPSGWGKTQTLEYMICDDLEVVKRGERSIIILESEGGLTGRIARHPYFDRTKENNIADKLYYIDPGQKGCMPSLSFFDLANKDMQELKPIEREKLSNHVVDLYRYVFRALRGAELTEKQGYVFGQLVQMLVWVPGASFDTLIDCLDDPELAQEFSQHAPKRSQTFFAEKYGAKNYAHTREEIFQRLDTFRSSAGTFVRMVSGTQSNFDLGKAMNDGSVIVINTSKEMLAEEGSAVFGRFMIALSRLASLQRSSEDTQTFVYVDEAQEYLDEKSGVLFQQARKRAIGLTIAHQDLQQVDHKLINTIQTNTAIKICGNGTYNDRQIMARNMNCTPEFFTKLKKKDRVGTEFGLFARDITPNGAVSIKVAYGRLDKAGLNRNAPKGQWDEKSESSLKGVEANEVVSPTQMQIWNRRQD